MTTATTLPLWLRLLRMACVLAVVAFVFYPRLVSEYPLAFVATVLVGLIAGVMSFVFAAKHVTSHGQNAGGE
jgi:hypothetical protein